MIKRPLPEKKAYTLAEFCWLYRISRAELYKLWDRGGGPRKKRIGKRRMIILVDDAEAWARSDGDESPQAMGPA